MTRTPRPAAARGEVFLVGRRDLIIGVFDDQAVANGECTTVQHWVQPLVPNQGAEFPKADRYYPVTLKLK